MDIEKFTERSRGFLQAAQTIAIRDFAPQLAPEHLLKALLDDEEGAAAGLIRTAGGDDRAVRAANDAELAKMARVQGVRRGPAAGDARLRAGARRVRSRRRRARATSSWRRTGC